MLFSFALRTSSSVTVDRDTVATTFHGVTVRKCTGADVRNRCHGSCVHSCWRQSKDNNCVVSSIYLSSSHYMPSCVYTDSHKLYDRLLYVYALKKMSGDVVKCILTFYYQSCRHVQHLLKVFVFVDGMTGKSNLEE